MIRITDDNKTFHIQTERTSYIISVLDSGHVTTAWFGSKIRHRNNIGNLRRDYPLALCNLTSYSEERKSQTAEELCLEAGTPGKGDYRSPSLSLHDTVSGDSVFDFVYQSHEITETKEELKGLPSALTADDKESRTLTLTLKDTARKVFLYLSYSSFPASDVITRNCRVENRTGQTLEIDRIMSYTLDLDLRDQDLVTLDGAWSRERHPHRRPLGPGISGVDSRRGVSSSAHNPFFIVADKNCDEQRGECRGFSLVYSGSHTARTETSPYGLIRIQAGIQDEGFRWRLEDGASFQAPEGVLSFSEDGFSGLSRNYHRFIQKHIVRGAWQYKERPVLINNWEATYFDFNEKKLLALAKEAATVGIELFVLDDGWFGKRNDDTTSLGDWKVNKKKLPGGLKGLQEKIAKLGLSFGLWVEPEMISLDSDLYREHPDWMVRSPFRDPSPGRNQYLLDLCRQEVRDYLVESLSAVFSSAEISYVKWDMNRNFSDCYSAALAPENQKEFAHRYVLGLYEILERLTKAFPDILFESCSAGGNRFDLGMLCFMPQTWTSDDTDAMERLPIQQGTSLFAPPSAIGAHVSACPNHQVLRESSMESRFNTAAFGVLGYELDLCSLSNFDKKVIKKQIDFYKANRQLLQFGKFRRINPLEKSNEYLWMVVSPDQKEAVAGWFRILAEPNVISRPLPLPGLDEQAEYKVNNREQYENIKRFGDLISRVLPVPLKEGSFVHEKIADNYMFKLEKDEVVLGGDFLAKRGYLPRPAFYGTGLEEGIIFLGDFSSRLFKMVKIDELS